MPLSEFQSKSSNWRAELRRNERRTRQVMFLFMFIYALLGLLIDLILAQTHYPTATVSQLFTALIYFKIIPYATISMAIAAIIAIIITFLLYDKIMLLGTNAHEITPNSAQTLDEKKLYNVVEEMKVASGLQFMPKVFVIDADYMNAFASGYSEKSAMVAITRGLLEKLDRDELQAVMAHELSHIRHHDIKLTLSVAVLSNIVLLVIDILFYNVLFGRNQRQDNRLLILVVALRYILPLITILLTLFLSRTREYMADAGAVELMRDNEPMARALLKISQDHANNAAQYANEYTKTPHEQVRAAAYIYDPASLANMKNLEGLFSTHPSIEKRLKAIGFARK